MNAITHRWQDPLRRQYCACSSCAPVYCSIVNGRILSRASRMGQSGCRVRSSMGRQHATLLRRNSSSSRSQVACTGICFNIRTRLPFQNGHYHIRYRVSWLGFGGQQRPAAGEGDEHRRLLSPIPPQHNEPRTTHLVRKPDGKQRPCTVSGWSQYSGRPLSRQPGVRRRPHLRDELHQ